MWRLKRHRPLQSACHYHLPWYMIFWRWALLPATTKHFAKPRVLYFAIAGSIERIPAFSYVDRTCISGGWSFSYADHALRLVEVISRRSALPRAFRRYISRLFRVVVFFGWMTPPIPPPRTLSDFNSPGAPAVLQAQPQSVSPAIDLDDALEALLEIDA